MNSIFGHEGIERLAGNPLLLTILVLIKRQGVELPNRRVELYELYLDTLLRSWNKARALDKTPVGPDIDYHEVWQILAPMALWLRRENPRAGLVSEQQFYDFLVRYYQEEEGCTRNEARQKTRDFLKSVHHYSSLLLERGRGRYGFIHQTLEEYLAGCGLTLLPRDEALQEILAHLDEPHWRETLLLGFGALGIVRKVPREAGELLERLLQALLPDATTGANMLLAGEVLRDVGQVGMSAKTARIITTAMVRMMQDASIQASGRCDAGLILGDLGWLPEDLDEFVVMEPGSFLYRDYKELRTISRRYWIAKYPVTNSQYAYFVEAGQAEPGYWSDKRFTNPLLPVVGVSWHDARAYCQWFNEQFKKEGFRVAGANERVSLPDGYVVRLPTEEEWERAARGTDGREYPWGNEFKAGYANTEESGLKKTTAVCTYPAGVSPVGAWDMAGNVWEWTVTLDGSVSVLRGSLAPPFLGGALRVSPQGPSRPLGRRQGFSGGGIPDEF